MMGDPGKGSKRRPGDQDAFSRNFDRIFAPKTEKIPGRRYYRQVRMDDGTFKLVELENPPPKLPEDLRFEGSFVSPVDGSIIRSKRALVDHNRRNGVTQVLPGIHEDIVRDQKERIDQAFGERSREDRIEDIKVAIEKGER